VLGVDLGTSRVKVLMCARDGEELGRGTASYRVLTPRPGHAETPVDDWWRATVAAVREATSAVRGATTAASIEAVAVTGQMHGVVLSAADGRALRPAITWLDRRAIEEAEGYAGTPNPPSPGMAGPILSWLRRHEPDLYSTARWALQPKDWLRMRLTGEAATEPTDASATLLYDPVQGVRVPGEHDRLLPPIIDSTAIAGTLRPGPAGELGLPEGIPVAAGAADTAASLLAARLPGPGWALLTLGSGGQWVMPADAPVPDPSGRTHLFRAVGPGTYRLAGAQNVGVALDWVRRALGATWDELYATSLREWEGAPLFRPYLVPERFSRTAGASWTGLTLSHGREDLMRAALAGVADLMLAHLVNLRAAGADPRDVLVSGGGSRDPAWRKLLADTLGLTLHEAGTPWLTARGAAMIAGCSRLSERRLRERAGDGGHGGSRNRRADSPRWSET
jgi:xylulokinase